MAEKQINLETLVEIFGDSDCTLKADGYDDCIVGIDSNQCLVYDMNKIIEKLSKDMSYDDAVEYFHYNIEGAHVGDFTPKYIIVFNNLEEMVEA
jgi:hypothetical protein|tara:strand:+ start:144 stop:425 length:282 start_codon:yes stop_codon:yes gene_type:complete